MPFGFRRKQAPVVEAPAAPVPPTPAEVREQQGVAFDGLTEEWRLVGRMHVDGRLSDALNRRAPIAIADVQWAPADGSGPLTPAPGLKSVDPYDLIIVLAGEGSLPPLSADERAAHKIHKVPYGVSLEVPPYRIVGTVFLFPGTEPEGLLDRSTEMFVPITAAHAYLGDDQIGDGAVDVVLVNRFYLRGVEQVDGAPPGPPAAKTDEGPPPVPLTDEERWHEAEAERALGAEAERAMEARADAQAEDDRATERAAQQTDEATSKKEDETQPTAEPEPEVPLGG